MENVKQIQKTDLELANEALAELKPNVTAADVNDSGRDGRTVRQYLSGQGTSLDTAVELLKFFRERIEKRRKVIAGDWPMPSDFENEL